MNIGTIARNIIASNPGASNADLLAMTKAAAAEAGLENKTTVACIAWYKNDMRKKGFKQSEPQVQRTADIVRSEIEKLQEELKMLEELETQALLDEEQELIEKLAKIKQLRGE